ncbi:MAG: zinc-ribbon domain-containing protein [Candidatus Lokiarchaeota archaeon]|nr:zinc-ribbon domain-containing protein [Candidatus Lokiarchaeota archaeon]
MSKEKESKKLNIACPFCGKRNDNKAKICEYCGNEL